MTNEEAIKTLEANYPDACFGQLREAVDAAIEALKAQDADSDTISRKAAIDALDCINGVEEVLRALPSAQPDLPIKEKCAFCPHCNNCDVNDDLSIQPCKDAISRQAAIDYCYQLINVEHQQGNDEMNYGYERVNQTETILHHLEIMPPAQPELPEFAQKVEEYRKSAPSFVRNQLVWALYQTWKEYDGRLVHQRGKENR